MNNAEILKRLFVSEEFYSGLAKENLSEKNMLNIIACAPVSFDIKIELLTKLCDSGSDLFKKYLNEIKLYYDKIKNPSDGDVLILFTCKTDDDGFTQRQDYIPVKNYDMAVNTIKKIKTPDENLVWYMLELWALKDDMFLPVRYVFIDESPCYFSDSTSVPSNDVFSLYPDLNIPFMFSAGDIVEVNCTPFAEKTKVLVLEVRDKYDCCQSIGLNFDGYYVKAGAIKHAHIFSKNEFAYPYSPLYKMKKCTTDNVLINKLSSYIKTNDAFKIYDYVTKNNVTSVELENFIDNN